MEEKAIQLRLKTIGEFLTDSKLKRQLLMAMPKHVTPDRLLRVAFTVIRTNPRLVECTKESLLACIMGAGQLGLDFEPYLRQAYMVPFWNSKRKCLEAKLIVGYGGVISLARRTAEIKDVTAQVVYSNDTFKIQYGTMRVLEHTPYLQGDRGEPIGAYAIFDLKDGTPSFDFMNVEEIEAIRKRSQAADSGPWVTDWDEMAKKTVIKRKGKLEPMSIEMAKAIEADDRAMIGESQSSLFLDEETMHLIEGEDANYQEEELNKFESLLAEKIGDSEDKRFTVEAFVAETASKNSVSPDEVKASATTQFNVFWQNFLKWEVAQKKKTDKPREPKKEEPPKQDHQPDAPKTPTITFISESQKSELFELLDANKVPIAELLDYLKIQPEPVKVISQIPIGMLPELRAMITSMGEKKRQAAE